MKKNIEKLAKPNNRLNNKNIPIGEFLLQNNLITQEQLDHSLEVQKSRGKRLGDTIIELGYVKEEDITKALSERLNVDYADLNKFKIKVNALDLITKTYAEENKIIPIECNDTMVVIATSDPMNFYLMEDIRIRTARNVKFVLSTNSSIERAIEQFYDEASSEVRADVNKQFGFEKLDILDLDKELKNEIENAPIVKFVNTLIYNAVSLNASDIHIEPSKVNTKVRMRIDGQLIEKMNISVAAHHSIVTRIKIMAKMDISEKRIPQDGRIEIEDNGINIELRISTIPTVFGEKVVMRVLGATENLLNISSLGLSLENRQKFEKIIKAPNGIVLVCGPTGSGKTTTLYSILKEVNKSTVNIITIEDPVEYRLDGISQIQVNNKTGLTFANGLRSILRQDPDIIMLGEIRDTETAEIAVKSSITGHLVLSTIHTNSATGTIPRLIDMGIEPFLLSSSLVGIVAQRLVKRLCPKCKFEYISSKEENEYLGIENSTRLYKATGCKECHQTGYRGRIAIHEILPITKEIKKMIGKNANELEIEEIAKKEGMKTLKEDGIGYILDGTISLEELTKVTYSL